MTTKIYEQAMMGYTRETSSNFKVILYNMNAEPYKNTPKNNEKL